VRVGRARGVRPRQERRRDARVRRAGEDRSDRTHGVAHDGPDRDLRPGDERLEGGERVESELAGAERQLLGRIGAVTAHVDREAMEPGGVEEDRVGQRAVARRLPTVDERDTGAGPPTAGRDEPGG
jgi:hypothetical protein